jgi:putative ABC transport system permease protein
MAKLAWRNVLRNWRHSLATLLAISAGFMAISLFDGFVEGVKNQLRDGFVTRSMIGNVVLYHKYALQNLEKKPWSYMIDAKDQAFVDEFVKHEPDYIQRVRLLRVTGMITNGRNNAVFMGVGFDIPQGLEVRGDRWGWNAVAGKPLHLAPADSVLLGTGMGTLLDCESTYEGNIFKKGGGFIAEERPFKCYRSRVQLSSTTENAQVNAVEANVTGLIDAGLREQNNRWVSMPIELAMKLFDTDKVTYIGVRLKSQDSASGFIERFKKAADSAGVQVEAMPWDKQATAANLKGALQIVEVFRDLFMAIVVIIAVMSIANTMMKAVGERISEIGTLRSLGFLQRNLTFMFACEGFLLGAFACGVGLLAASGIAFVVTRLGFTYRAGLLSIPIPLEVLQLPVTWACTASLLLILASATAWFSARRVCHMRVAEALK